MTEKILLLFTAMRDRRTPWYAKAMVFLLLAYIISPIDIIPDFIPVVGLLDEIILVPIALAFIFKFIPESVQQGESLSTINEVDKKKLVIYGIVLVVTVWLLCLLIFLSLVSSDTFSPIFNF